MKTLGFVFALILLGTPAIQATPIVFIVRHAEKASSDGNDPDLSPDGQKRAEALARILGNADITAIFTTELKRTRQTAALTAEEMHVGATVIPANDTPALASQLRALKGNALVVGHGNTIPDLLKALGIKTPIIIPDDDYSEFFVVIMGDRPELIHLHYPL